MKEASLDPNVTPLRSRNQSIPDFVDPNEVSINIKIFSNASKAITSGQGELLKMFIKKHPGVCRIRHEVPREGRTKVDKETGEKVVEGEGGGEGDGVGSGDHGELNKVRSFSMLARCPTHPNPR